MTTAYFLLGRIPRISWAPGDARISPLQHSSMTSRPKWEELARDGCCGVFFFCCSCRALTYTLCLSSKIELILEQKLAIFLCSLGERFLYGSQRD